MTQAQTIPGDSVPRVALLPARRGHPGALACVAVLLIAAAAVLLLLYETRPRDVTLADGSIQPLVTSSGGTAAFMGMNPDGCTYLGASRNVAAGRGACWAFGPINEPVVHFPPLFPLVVGGLARVFGSDALPTGRWFHAALLGLDIVLLGWAVWRCTRSALVAAAAAAFVPLTRDMLESHANYMSEPLFVTLGFIGLLLLDRGVRRQWLLAMAGVGLLMGATCWVRYAGVSFIVTGVLTIATPLLADLINRRWRLLPRRLGQLLAFGLPAFALSRGLLAYNMHYNHGQPFNRDFVWQPANMPDVWRFFRAVGCWFTPTAAPDQPLWGLPPWCGLGLVFLLVWFWARRGRQRRPDPAGAAPRRGGLWTWLAQRCEPLGSAALSASQGPVPPPMLAVLWFIPVYIGLMLFSILCVRPAAVPMEVRLAIPLLMPLVLTCAWLIHRALRQTRSWTGALIAGSFFLILAGSNAYRVNNWLAHRGEERYLLFSAPPWTDSPLVAAVRQIPENATLYTNGCDVIYYLTGHSAAWTPRISPLPEYELAHAVAEMRGHLAGGDVYVAMFHHHWFESCGALSDEQLARLVPLEAVEITADGTLYRLSRTFVPPPN